MAKIYGCKSKYLVSNDNKLWIIGTLIVPIISIIIWYYTSKFILNISVSKINIYVIFAFFILIFFGFKKFFKFADKTQKLSIWISNKFHKGWKGEEEVLNVLKNLSDNYIVFYDVSLYNKGNIDFVLLGPCGLLAIEVKSHYGNFSYQFNDLLNNGYTCKRNFIKQAKRGAVSLNKYLLEKINKNIFVIPILVFSNKYSKIKFGFNQIDGCYVIKKEWLIELITKLPCVFNQNDINLVELELSKLYVAHN